MTGRGGERREGEREKIREWEESRTRKKRGIKEAEEVDELQ